MSIKCEMSSRERLLRTFDGQETDRIPTFDIIHNIPLIEHLTGKKITPKNAEDLLCKAVNKVLDLVRHFAIPENLETKIIKDENGFAYKYEWWTAHLVHRPKFDSVQEIEDSVKRDIEIIYDSMDKNRLCHVARQHAQLYDEKFDTIEELKSDYKKLHEKLDGTLMLPPEDVAAVSVATERYDETGWTYLYYDYPKTAKAYLDALTDYQLWFIDNFADSSIMPFAQISVPVGTNVNLLYPPEFFKNEVIHREKMKIDRWKSHGYHVMAFLDGYKWPVLDDFISLGVEEVHPCESYCRMEVGALRDKYPEIVLSQPIDCAYMLAYGNESDVKEAVIKAIEDAGRRKIIIGSTSEIHPQVKIENAMAMYETARNYRWEK